MFEDSIDRDPQSVACIFCAITRGDVKTDYLYEDDEVVAFRDINPQAPFHVLVVPRRHFPSVDAMIQDVQDIEILGRLLVVAVLVARKQKLSDSGYRVVTNHGPHGAQSVDHTHFHVLGGHQLGGRLG